MELKKIMSAVLMLSAVSFSASSANARTEAFAMHATQYPGSGASCYVCHVGSPGALTSYGVLYKGSGGDKRGTLAAMVAIEGLDADGDGVNNVLEFRTATDVNNPASNSGVVGSHASGDVLVFGSNVATVTLTSATATDLYTDSGVTLASGQEILGGVKVALTLGSSGAITVAYEDSASGIVNVYEVGSSTPVPSTVNTSGSISFTTTSATPSFYVERTTPITGGGGGGGGSSGGCLRDATTTPLMMFLVLLSLGFVARRKRV